MGYRIMKKEEKTKRTYERILMAAMEEFGTKNYDTASLTTLCNENQISKGLIYHNFKNKDELYLKCVEKCFDEMVADFEKREYKAESKQESLHNLFQMREQFFEEHPYYCHIFFNAVLQPPRHLQNEIHNLRQKYDVFYVKCFWELLQKTQLREGITVETATEYFLIFVEMYNGYFQNKFFEEDDFRDLIKNHEVNLSKILDIMLYGVAKQEEK